MLLEQSRAKLQNVRHCAAKLGYSTEARKPAVIVVRREVQHNVSSHDMWYNEVSGHDWWSVHRTGKAVGRCKGPFGAASHRFKRNEKVPRNYVSHREDKFGLCRRNLVDYRDPEETETSIAPFSASLLKFLFLQQPWNFIRCKIPVL